MMRLSQNWRRQLRQVVSVIIRGRRVLIEVRVTAGKVEYVRTLSGGAS